MNKLTTTYTGLQLDTLFMQHKEGSLTYALNCNIQSKDGFSITYTNEMSNQICTIFPTGYTVIGFKNIIEKNEIIFALVNSAGNSLLGRLKNYNCNTFTTENIETYCSCVEGKKLVSTVLDLDSCCDFQTIVNTTCLGWDIDHPVRMSYKITNCGYRLYFTDDLNPMRYVDLDNDPDAPYGRDSCNEPYPSFDCDRIEIFKDFCIPDITPVEVTGGGNLQAGVYQILIAYTDVRGQEFTDYFQATNPIHVYDRSITIDTDYYTNKAIKFKISHNTTEFEYFKIAIIKTVNETSEYLEFGNYKVSTPNFIVYTGNDKELIRTSLEQLRIGKPAYTKAKFIEESSNHLVFADLEADPEYNFQPFVNQMLLYWETISVPYNKINNYFNPLVASKFRTYMRDEVYPMGIRFKLKNGKMTKAFHIPNWRDANGLRGFDGLGRITDLELIPAHNQDNIQTVNCDDPIDKPRWKVYNTGTKLGIVPEPTTSYRDEKICDIVRHEYGEFSYWQSTETYPCDERIWGDLAGKPIRYHKFPDSVITHIHDSFGTTSADQYDINHNSYIYPIGMRIDNGSFNNLLDTYQVYNPETKQYDLPIKDLVCGFELVRGNRVGHKSIDAKGIFYDVGKITEYDNSTSLRSYYHANYPYNDHADDYYLSNNRNIYNTPDPDNEDTKRVTSYKNSEFRRFTFHSPDTHFQSPQLGNIIKMETEEFGEQEGHFVQVQDHPRYKFLTKFDSILAASLGSISALKISSESETQASVPPSENSKGKIEFNYGDMITTANEIKQLIETVIPRRNFAYAYHSRAVYNNYVPIPNNDPDPSTGRRGTKIRSTDIARYASPNNQNLGDDASFYNYGRESSVYLKVNQRFKRYTKAENSRFTLGNNPLDSNWCEHPERVHTSEVRSFYGSIKRDVPDQYGNIENIRYVSTGYTTTFENNRFIDTYYPAFGGDTFIGQMSLKRKMPFFTQNMVGRPDEVDFDYDLVPNLAFPNYYIGTSPDEVTLKEILGTDEALFLTLGLAGLIAGQLLPVGAGIASKIANLAAITGLGIGGLKVYSNILNAFIIKNNLDCDTTPANFNPTDINDIISLPQGSIFYQTGKFYLAAYGIPTFFVESDINLELRHARNEKEENFYPNVGNSIPDDWLQEKTVPILYDNKYNYNATYSSQNNQDFIESFNNFNFDKLCQYDFSNRVIYSEKSNNEENFDNWLKYSANNYFDFNKSNGKITGIHGLENNKLLVKFENTFQIYNTKITLQSNSPFEVAVSGSGMFTTDPSDATRSVIGFAGSQNIAFEKTPYGSFWVDAKRGDVFRFNDGIQNISQGPNYNWFKENLPFKILKDVPDTEIDNSFKDIGISLCWDERFKRLFLTKLDYELRPEFKGLVNWSNGTFFYTDLDVVKVIELSDTEYFTNKSFTISWSPIIENWVSFYSFLPNYYIPQVNHFMSGIHNSIWNHNLSNLSYQTYYDTLYPHIIEYPIANVPNQEILKSITVHENILKYITEDNFYSLSSVNKENYDIFFNKCIIYNKEQCSGLLTLTETPINNLRVKMQYPIYNRDNINILYSKYDKVFTFNNFNDVTLNYNNGQPMFVSDWDEIETEFPIDKVLNIDNSSYTNRLRKPLIRSNDCKVRLIQDRYSRYKFITNFIINNQESNTNR